MLDGTPQIIGYDADTGEPIYTDGSTPDVSTREIPANYVRVLDEIDPTIVKKITDTQAPNEHWTDTLTKLFTSIAAGTQQLQLMQINVNRARNGMAPLDIAGYSGFGVNIGLSPDTQKLILIGGLAVAALVLLTRSSK
jgi:hypothetical protein